MHAAVYYITCSRPCAAAQDADELPLVREESEAIAAAAVADAGLGRRTYVLRPIDGRLRYTRRGRDARSDESQAAQDADVELDALSLHLASAAPVACCALTEQVLTVLLLMAKCKAPSDMR